MQGTRKAAVRFRERVQPILESYCYGCHGNGEKKGNRTLDEFSSDDSLLGNIELWQAVLKNVRAGLRTDLAGHRDELVISTKAGWDMWPGPYGDWGSRKYLLASLDQSLARMGLEYVDIFYHHRPDPETPLEETMGALATAVHQGKALYVGISQYQPRETHEAVKILSAMGVHLLIHQPVYSMLNRWIEPALLDALYEEGVGCIAFSPLAQGQLTDRYADGVPAGSRATQHYSLDEETVQRNIKKVVPLREIARRRGQSLAQMALAWVLRDPRMTSAVNGVSSVKQLDENLAALDRLDFSQGELAEIDRLTS